MYYIYVYGLTDDIYIYMYIYKHMPSGRHIAEYFCIFCRLGINSHNHREKGKFTMPHNTINVYRMEHRSTHPCVCMVYHIQDSVNAQFVDLVKSWTNSYSIYMQLHTRIHIYWHESKSHAYWSVNEQIKQKQYVRLFECTAWHPNKYFVRKDEFEYSPTHSWQELQNSCDQSLFAVL